MATSTDRRLAHAIISYLQHFAQGDNVSADKKESIEVAVQILRSAFGISAEDSVILDTGVSLLSLFEQASGPEKETQSPEDVAKAESLKCEGNDLMSFGQFEEATQKYTEAIALVRSPIYYCNRAAAYSKLGKHQEALNDCRKAVELNPNYNKAYGRMGLAYYNLGNYEEAAKTYRKAYELDPNNESFLCNMRLSENKIASEQPSASQSGAPLAQERARNMVPALASLMNSPSFLRTVQTLSQLPVVRNVLDTFSRELETTNQPGLPQMVNMIERLATSFESSNPDLNWTALAEQLGASSATNENATNQTEENKKKPPDEHEKKQQ